MTNIQKKQITDMRKVGSSYAAIAACIGLSINTVKSFCKRNKITVNKIEINVEGIYCTQCGKVLIQMSGRKFIKFCDANCRVNWWNSHLEKVNKKAIYSYTCAYCKKPFTAYGNAERRYCSHSCYIAKRFRKVDAVH